MRIRIFNRLLTINRDGCDWEAILYWENKRRLCHFMFDMSSYEEHDPYNSKYTFDEIKWDRLVHEIQEYMYVTYKKLTKRQIKSMVVPSKFNDVMKYLGLKFYVEWDWDRTDSDNFVYMLRTKYSNNREISADLLRELVEVAYKESQFRHRDDKWYASFSYWFRQFYTKSTLSRYPTSNEEDELLAINDVNSKLSNAGLPYTMKHHRDICSYKNKWYLMKLIEEE